MKYYFDFLFYLFIFLLGSYLAYLDGLNFQIGSNYLYNMLLQTASGYFILDSVYALVQYIRGRLNFALTPLLLHHANLVFGIDQLLKYPASHFIGAYYGPEELTNCLKSFNKIYPGSISNRVFLATDIVVRGIYHTFIYFYIVWNAFYVIQSRMLIITHIYFGLALLILNYYWLYKSIMKYKPTKSRILIFASFIREVLTNFAFTKDTYLFLFRGWRGLSEREQLNLSKRFNLTLRNTGPFFQKIGQIVSAMEDRLPTVLTDQLKDFQEANWVDLCSFEEIDRIIKQQAIYSEIEFINYVPVSSGTVAQVHKAMLKSGQVVAIKIVKPNIHDKFHKNLLLVKYILSIIGYFGIDIDYVAHQINIIGENLLEQTDLRFEYQMIERFRENNKYALEKGKICLPEVVGQPHEDVLVTHWIDGVSCGQFDWSQLSEQARLKICDKITRVIIDSVANDGIYHIDLHPGNIMYNLEREETYLIDFGLMAQSDAKTKRYHAELTALLSEREIDYDRLADLEIENTFVINTKIKESYQEFKQEIMDYYQTLFGNHNADIIIDLIKSRKKIKQKYSCQMTKNNNSFGLAVLCLESTVKTICPKYDINSLFRQNLF